MKALPIITITLTLTLLGGCQTNLDWTPLDGANADANQLEEARKACRIDIKLAGVDRAEEERDEKLSQSSTDQAKMLVKEDYDELRRQVYREIDTCMRKQGYKR
jgi:hypothetical protein